MARKSTKKEKTKKLLTDEVLPPADPIPKLITDTIKDNYMPYVMTVIVSRAIPEIDGFKPSQRKLLYTMYKMGLMTGHRTKSTNIVGQTMKLNPHGDAAIYETLVRLTRGNEALLHPFVDSKGCFGKQYSRDMAYAAPRYTEAKLDPFCTELFKGIDKNAVDMVPNYDNTMQEPVLFPTTFPNILVSPNSGIAVGMASSFCSFNLSEVCDATIAILRNPKTDVEKILDIMAAPDFSGGAELIYNRDEMREIYRTGKGSVKLRAKYEYDKKENCIDVKEIPYSTSIEAIMKKLTELYKVGKLKEVADFRDEIDLNGFKLTIDLKRGVDPDKFMAKLFRSTPLMDSFDCNFNLLIEGVPYQLGVVEILREWIKFRINCFTRESRFELGKKNDKLHLLLGLGKILLDIDKAIAIVRSTEKEADVVPNLCREFEIDEIQAEYIAEIKLRHLNREYILERIKEIEELQKEIAELEDMLSDELKIRSRLSKQLEVIKRLYGKPRRTTLVGADEVVLPEPEEEEATKAVLVLTRMGYLKVITPQSLRGSDVQKLKDGDEIVLMREVLSNTEISFFTDRCKLYNAAVSDFHYVKASDIGEYIPVRLKMEDGEQVVSHFFPSEMKEKDDIIFLFENGKGVKIKYEAYKTKGTRKKLTGAYSSASPIVAAIPSSADINILLENDQEKGIIISSNLIPEKTTRTAGGVQLLTLKGKQKMVSAQVVKNKGAITDSGLKKLKIPASGSGIKPQDRKKLFASVPEVGEE